MKNSDKKFSSTIALVWDLPIGIWTKITLTWVLLLEKLKRIEPLDPLVAFCVLVALANVNTNPNYWALYALGCSLCMILMITKKLYFNAMMKFVALAISIGNLLKG